MAWDDALSSRPRVLSSRPEYSFRSMSRILSYSFFRMSGSSWPTMALWESWMAMRCSSDISSSVMMQGMVSRPAEMAAWTRWLPDSTSYFPSVGSRQAKGAEVSCPSFLMFPTRRWNSSCRMKRAFIFSSFSSRGSISTIFVLIMAGPPYRFCECFFFQRASPSFSVHWPMGAP